MCEITAYPDYCCFNNPFKPVTHVIFDLDGTILDTEKVYNEAYRSICREFNAVYTEELHQKILGVTEPHACTTIVKELNLPIEPEEFIARFQEIAYKKLPDGNFMPGAEKLIRHLYEQKIPIAVGTGSTSMSVEYKFQKKQDIFNMFDHIVCASTDEDVLRGKPAPDVWIVAARRFPDRPRRKFCMVFEDGYQGICGALACGMQAIVIPDENMPYENWKNATLKINSFVEFMDIMQLFGLPPIGTPIPEKQEKKDKRQPSPAVSFATN